MELKKPISHLLEQLKHVLEKLTPEAYTKPVPVLSGSSIGQHSRHIMEFYIALEKGYQCGKVNYDDRIRDHRIESDLPFALLTLKTIQSSLDKADKDILLQASYSADEQAVVIETNYYRELIYNLEHTVHHMAHIRIGINEVAKIDLPESFGVAASTLANRRLCAQ